MRLSEEMRERMKPNPSEAGKVVEAHQKEQGKLYKKKIKYNKSIEKMEKIISNGSFEKN